MAGSSSRSPGRVIMSLLALFSAAAGPQRLVRHASAFSVGFVQWQRAVTPKATRGHSSSVSTEPSWRNEISFQDCEELMAIAQQAARAAGSVITANLGCSSELDGEGGCSIEGQDFSVKTTIKDIVTQYDEQAQKAVEEIVRTAFPEHQFLGEEDVAPGPSASEAALSKALQESLSGFVWICDPIDGTANFAAGMNLCAVTVSLVYKGTPILGVVFDPHANEMFSAVQGQGAFLNNHIPLQTARGISDIKDSIINAGCPADPNAFEASMRGVLALNSECRGLRMIACSALTTAWIAAGRMTAHFGYDLSSWDLVAGALLIQEAGGLVTDLDGSPYRVETRNMLCSNGVVHDQVLDVLRKADAISFKRSSK